MAQAAATADVSLRERVSFGDKPKYDLAKGVVYNVRVLGPESENGHDYPEATQRAALPLLERAVVYTDHPKGRDNGRSIRERFGRLVGLKVREGVTYADEFRFNPRHEFAPTLGWFLENDPDGIGLSINARGDTKRSPRGREIVERINRVFSVDLVDHPATNKSLHEQTKLRETAVDDPNAPLTDPAGADTAAPGGDAGDAKTHLVNAITALAQSVKDGTASSADVKKQITDILAMVDAGGGKADGDGDTGCDDGDTGCDDAEAEFPDDAGDDTEKAVTESLLKLPNKAARWAGRRLLRERRRKLAAKTLPDKAITEAFLADLADVSDEKAERMVKDRAAVVGSVAGPKSFPRDPNAAGSKLREQADKPAAASPDRIKQALDGLLAE